MSVVLTRTITDEFWIIVIHEAIWTVVYRCTNYAHVVCIQNPIENGIETMEYK